MKSILYIACSLGVLVGLNACAPSLYFPDKVVTTTFTGKDQAVLNCSVKPQNRGADSTGRPGSSVSLAASAAYALTDEVGVYLAYNNLIDRTVREFGSLSRNWRSSSKTGGIFNGNRYEAGLVFFKPSSKTMQQAEKGLFECAVGYSFGNLHRTSDLIPEDNFDIRYFNVFIQPSVGVRGDNFSFSGGLKVWYQRYYDFQASPDVISRFNSGMVPLVDRPYLYVNPFMNADFGFKFAQFNAQVGFPTHVRLSHEDPILMGFPLYLSLGITFRLEDNIFSDLKSKHKQQ